MKANNGKGNNPGRDEWITPDWIFKPLNEQYKFFIDCCATQKNTKCNKFFDNFEDTDFIHGGISCWMNPPFSKAWKMFEQFFKIVSGGVAIYRCDNFETALWQKVIFPHASWIFIPDRRVSYEGLDGDGARFPSALIGYHVPKPEGLKGTILKLGATVR